jgi:prepilin-type processing-associated H-X9-DG protein
MLQTPNSKHAECEYDVQTNPGANAMNSARSRHPGSVNSLFADGSVRFIKGSISPTTWWAMGTRAGGEVTSAHSF